MLETVVVRRYTASSTTFEPFADKNGLVDWGAMARAGIKGMGGQSLDEVAADIAERQRRPADWYANHVHPARVVGKEPVPTVRQRRRT